MGTFQVVLPEALKPFLESQAKAEGFEGPSDYLLAIVQRAQRRAEIEAKILVGLDQLDAGLGIEMTADEWQKLHEEHRQRHGMAHHASQDYRATTGKD